MRSSVSKQYEAVLEGKKVEVIYDDRVIWTSPQEIKVQEALYADIDGDDRVELILLCWKIGRYGRSRPFWIEEDEKKWSQHIFVYTCKGDEIAPKWMSSYIGQDVVTMEGIAGERSCTKLLLTDREGEVSRWAWDSWGFAKEDTEVSFVVFGDNLIHEPIYQYGLHNDKDFSFLFENMRDVIDGSDIAVLNQETPLTDEPACYSGYPRFGTPVEVGEAVVEAGFDVVTCGTNHALDQGTDGVDFTKEFFTSRDVLCLGIQRKEEREYEPYTLLTRKGIRFALLNYTYGINGPASLADHGHMVHLLEDEDQIRMDLERAGAESDFVIVFVHWGTEYAQEADDFQKRWAQVFLECKADVVVGTHPHALQPYEMLADESGHVMLLYYSIGNYISAQSEQACVKGGVAEFTVSLTPDGYQAVKYGLKPLQITWQEDGKCTVDMCP